MISCSVHFRELPTVAEFGPSLTLRDENGANVDLFALGDFTKTELIRHLRDRFNEILGETDNTHLVNAVACGMVE